MKKNIYLTIIISALFTAGAVFAEIKVVSVKGEASLKQGRNWVPLTAGQKIPEGSVISTGAKSSAKIKIDAHDVTIRPLTTIKIFRNTTSADSNDTNVGLKHGSIKAKVNKMGKLKTNFNIATPVATSSVRGTEQEVSYGSSTGMKVEILEGVVKVHNQSGVSRTVQGNLGFSQQNGAARSDSPVADIRSDSVPQIIPEGTTAEEAEAVVNSGATTPSDAQEAIDIAAPANKNVKVNVDLQWPR